MERTRETSTVTDRTREESGVQKHLGRTTVKRREMKKAQGMIREKNTKGKSRNPLLSGPNAGDLERSTVVERG